MENSIWLAKAKPVESCPVPTGREVLDSFSQAWVLQGICSFPQDPFPEQKNKAISKNLKTNSSIWKPKRTDATAHN